MKVVTVIKKTGKWIGYIISGILVLVLIIYAYASFKFNSELKKVYTVAPIDIQIPYDSLSIAKGAHLFAVHGCQDCHGKDMKGKVMIDDPVFGYLKAANLTRGKGGLPEGFSDQDWLRALKHGLNREGKPLIVMPSNESTRIPDKDLAAIIAFCKTSEPVDNDLEAQKAGPLAKILQTFGKINLLPATEIDHSITPIAKPDEKVSLEFGATLTINCTACHRSNFEGGPPLIAGYPPVPNITSTGRAGKWTEEQFIKTLRTGITPDRA